MKKIEARKLGWFEKFWLRLKFPKIPSKDGSMITITKGEYDLMKNMLDKEECFLTQIHNQNKRIRDLEEKVKEKEKARRKVAGKVGGMQKELNKCKKDKITHQNF